MPIQPTKKRKTRIRMYEKRECNILETAPFRFKLYLQILRKCFCNTWRLQCVAPSFLDFVNPPLPLVLSCSTIHRKSSFVVPSSWVRASRYNQRSKSWQRRRHEKRTHAIDDYTYTALNHAVRIEEQYSNLMSTYLWKTATNWHNIECAGRNLLVGAYSTASGRLCEKTVSEWVSEWWCTPRNVFSILLCCMQKWIQAHSTKPSARAGEFNQHKAANPWGLNVYTPIPSIRFESENSLPLDFNRQSLS